MIRKRHNQKNIPTPKNVFFLYYYVICQLACNLSIIISDHVIFLTDSLVSNPYTILNEMNKDIDMQLTLTML